MTASEQVAALENAWEKGHVQFPRLVLELEAIVASARDELGEEAWRAAFREWGQLEIINALTLDADVPLSPEDVRDATEHINRLRIILADGAPR